MATTHDDTRQFEEERRERIRRLGEHGGLRKLALDFTVASVAEQYSYNFDWLGIPIIQHPEDIVAMQEIVWRVKPDLIVETGIARGGSIIFYASLLELLGNGTVLGIDVDIREHNRKRIEAHPLMRRIEMIEGSSVAPEVVAQVRRRAEKARTVLVVLDSSHAHDHVLQELRAYTPFVTRGSYCVVFDTIIEDMPEGTVRDRPWGKGANPKTAVRAFLQETDAFAVDREVEHKLLITAAPDGYLKRIA